MENKTPKYTIIKKIAKHGKQTVIIIPKVLENQLKAGTIVQLGIDVLENSKVLEGVE
jgi:hypothetical protein